MKKKTIYGVITGDLVKSRQYGINRNIILKTIKQVLSHTSNIFAEKGRKIWVSDIFRGDSFQMVISDFDISLKILLYLRTAILKCSSDIKSVDVRLSLGLGTVESLNTENISESDGEAFSISGRNVDRIKSFRRLEILSSYEQINKQLMLLASVGDAIMRRWTEEQVEAMFYWLQDNTQASIAKKTGTTQSAVSQKLQIAGVYAIEDMLSYFSELMGRISLETSMKKYQAGDL